MDATTLQLAKKYTDATAAQFGGLKGASCQFAASTVAGGHLNTFTWENDDGDTQTTSYTVLDGTQVEANPTLAGTEDYLESIEIDGVKFAVPSGSESDYPDYAKTEMEVVSAKIQNYIDTLDNPIIIGFSTDQHIDPTTESPSYVVPRQEVGYGLKTLRDLATRHPFNLVVLGGDTHGGGSGTIANMQASASFISNQLTGIKCPLAMLVGNHEGGQDNQSITRGQVYKSHMTEAMQNKVITTLEKTNGYYDDPSCSIRFIFVDSFARNQIPYSVEEINTHLASMLSTIPEGYKAIIFSHHPLDSNLQNEGWVNPTNCHSTLQTYKDKIIACFDGHTHMDLTEQVDGITFVSTTCAGNVSVVDGSTRIAGTADFTAYDVFVIDTKEKVIHAIRYGSGEDRTISYAGARGNILANINWTDDKAINSNAQLVDASGYSVTDAIEEVYSGDVLYFADGVAPVTPSSTWDLYSDDGTFIKQMDGISAETYGATYANDKLFFVGLTSSGTKVISYHYYGILRSKNPESLNIIRFALGEFTFWESGFIKSCKIAYDGEHNQGIAKVRFCFPTAKKAVLDIRVNEPFAEE